jgi:hypothetical protein
MPLPPCQAAADTPLRRRCAIFAAAAIAIAFHRRLLFVHDAADGFAFADAAGFAAITTLHIAMLMPPLIFQYVRRRVQKKKKKKKKKKKTLRETYEMRARGRDDDARAR